MAPPPGYGVTLAAWYDGQDFVRSSDNLRLLSCPNAAGGPNPGLLSAGLDGLNGPYMGLDSLDGTPGATFEDTDGSHYHLVQPSLGGFARHFRDLGGNLFGYGSGETDTWTLYEVMLPRWISSYDIVGGTLLRFGQTAGGGNQDAEFLFNVEPTTTSTTNYMLFSNQFRTGPTHLCGPSGTTGGAGGTYTGQAMLGAWSSGGFNDVHFFRNGTEVPLNPAVLQAPFAGAAVHATSTWGSADQGGDLRNQFHGVKFLTLLYQEAHDAGQRLAVMGWLSGRFPSLALPVPLSIIPSPAAVAPNGRVNFSGAGGTAPYTYSIVTNRSGGSINAATGAYLAGPHGEATDVVRVTDTLAAVADANVAVGPGLWQRTQKGIVPPFLRLRNGQLIEGDYGAEKDTQFERMRQGLLSNMPNETPADGLEVVGQERLLPRAVDIDGNPIEADGDYREHLRTSWTSSKGWKPGGSHASMLRALDRAGFPMGDPDGAHIIQVYKRWSWLSASGGTPVYATHTRRWRFGGLQPNMWNAFAIVFGADVPELTVGSPAAERLNATVDDWQPRKARFMGTWIIVSGLAWGWPPGVHHWGDPGLVWGGVVRKIPPL